MLNSLKGPKYILRCDLLGGGGGGNIWLYWNILILAIYLDLEDFSKGREW